jgi:ferredoxin-NADP reductase/DMSO/TMAO reductase YedYZ heme-binding membrane subunit
LSVHVDTENARRGVPGGVAPGSGGVASDRVASGGGASGGFASARRRTPGWWRDGVGSATWGSMIVVLALWLSNGGVQSLGTEPFTGLGRLTGLIAADLLLIQVFLMARVPVIERSYGQDELARRHRLVGFTSFNLMMAHVVLIILGYAHDSSDGIIGTTVDLVLNYPGMLLALVATVLLVMVVVTSIRKARARLRYESWHLLHLYAYLGVGLSIPHEIWTGADFTSSRLAQLYWWSLYAVAAGAVIGYRILLPAWRSWRHELVVEKVTTEAPGVLSVYLRGRHLDRLPVRAGQFFTWRFRDGPGWTRGNPYSLSAAPSRNRLRITVKDLGDGSARLATLRPGTRAFIEGPYGRLSSDVQTQPKVTLLASGIGVTPMRALLEELDYGPGEATLIYRATREADVAFRAELDDLARRRGARVFYVVGPRISYRKQTWLPGSAAHLSESEALLQLVPDLAEQDVYVCGSEGWMDAVQAAALEAGVPASRIHCERFSW